MCRFLISDALVFTDDVNKQVCICLESEGGAIVSADNYEEAREKFIEAMGFSENIFKIMHFKKHGKFPEQELKK